MLELFILETCGYCKRVMEYLDEHKISYTKIDIADTKNLDLLLRIGGKRQVPFLVDKEHNVEMYESNDIIEYLKTL